MSEYKNKFSMLIEFVQNIGLDINGTQQEI